MEIIKIGTDANYDDHKYLFEHIMKVWCLEEKPAEILFDIKYKDREDDTITIACNIAELLECIGKVIVKKD